MIALNQLAVQPLRENRVEFYDLCRKYSMGLEIISFAFPAILYDRIKLTELLKSYQYELSEFKCSKSMHRAFMDIVPHSPDTEVSTFAQNRINQCLQIASELSCQHVIFHSQYNPLIRNPGYAEIVVEGQARLWKEMLRKFPNLIICLENMWDATPDVLWGIIERTGSARLGVCLDVGHLNVYSKISKSSWFERLGKSICYMHWNDNHGSIDSELLLGEGNINWDEIVHLVDSLPKKPLIVLEVGKPENVIQSLKFLSAKGFIELSIE